jgi:signal transduction histidine kinase
MVTRRLTQLLARYSVAIGSASVAFALAITLEHPWVTLSPFFLFYGAVAISSWYGGAGPGILATAIGALAADYHLLEPQGSLEIEHQRDVARLALFAIVGILIASLNGALRRAQQRCSIEADAARRSEAEVQSHQQRLQAMASELMMVEERERRRIATVLHDAVVQTLALSKLKLDRLRRTQQDGIHERLTEVYDLIDKSITHTRTLTAELSPPVLYELGLPPAIQWLGDRLQSEHGIAFELVAPKEWVRVSEQLRVVLFQAVRELLMNVVKHSKAAHCRVIISRKGASVRIEVEDDGVGATEPATTNYVKGGFGLFNIRQRLTHLGGSMQVKTEPDGGTTVILTAPVGAADERIAT